MRLLLLLKGMENYPYPWGCFCCCLWGWKFVSIRKAAFVVLLLLTDFKCFAGSVGMHSTCTVIFKTDFHV